MNAGLLGLEDSRWQADFGRNDIVPLCDIETMKSEKAVEWLEEANFDYVQH